MESHGDSPPLWTQYSTNPIFQHQRRLRSRSISPIFNPVSLIILLSILALVIIFFLVPLFLSHTTQIIRPTYSVKKGWDSFSFVLVILAIFCGVFAKRNDDVSAADERTADNDRTAEHTESSSGSQWFNVPPPVGLAGTGVSRLRRSCSSYPDLRQGTLWETGETRYDFEVNLDRQSQRTASDTRRSMAEKEESEIKAILMDTLEVHSARPPSPEPPPKPATAPPTPPAAVEFEQKLQLRKSGTAKEITSGITSLYNQTKRKKRSNRRDNSSESSSESSPPSVHSAVPPPPPLPHSKVFQNLFKKSTKVKRVHSVSATAPPPPPPPPPPPNSIFNNLFKTGKSKRFSSSTSAPPPSPPPPSSILNNFFKHGSESRRFKSEISAQPPPPPRTPPEPFRRQSSATSKPPLPSKSTIYYYENLNSGAQSPLTPIPPPPPFSMPDFKFRARGDFVRIGTTHSSRCSSPGLEDVDDVMTGKPSEAMDGSDPIGPSVFCPSPDVNLKADSFIARLKGEWRLEKMNSMKEKNNSGHGPSPELF